MEVTKSAKHLGINCLIDKYKPLRTYLYFINTDAVYKNIIGISANSDGIYTNSFDTLKRYITSPLFIVK